MTGQSKAFWKLPFTTKASLRNTLVAPGIISFVLGWMGRIRYRVDLNDIIDGYLITLCDFHRLSPRILREGHL